MSCKRVWPEEFPITKRRTPAFVPVLMPGMAAGNDGLIVIELRRGRVLRVPPGLPSARVTELVRAVEAAS